MGASHTRLHQQLALRAVGWVVSAAAWCATADAQVAGAPKRPATDAPARSCATAECHQPIVKHSVLHNPTNADCSACHLSIGEAKDHKFALAAPVDQVCLKCHQLPPQHSMHAPVRDGKCLECHDAHGSEFKAVLRGDPDGGLCVKCHENAVGNRAFVHGPAAVGACTACHAWHSSPMPKLLLAEGNALCLKCHEDAGQGGPGVRVHKALEQGCTKCHDPHASDHKFQLTDSTPNLCLSCHKDKFESMTAGATVVHGAVTAEGGCATCHEAHRSSSEKLLKGAEPDSCLKCHDQPVKAHDGATLMNMSKLLANNPVKHGPIRDGHCSLCHDPHASASARLLPAAYPAKFYAPFSPEMYALCFQCHSSDLATKPNGQGVTQFRDGTRNLHALHVNQEKGRTCRACHEIHASKRPTLIRESVPFGNSNWMLAINYKAETDGGSCAPGCHAPKKYTRPAAALPPTKQRPNTPSAAALLPQTPAPTAPGDPTAPAGAPTPPNETGPNRR